MTAITSSSVTYTNHVDVLDKDLTSPPVTPDPGDRYIVGDSASGDWSTHDNEITEYNGASWDFTVPSEEDQVLVVDEDLVYRFEDDAWTSTGKTGDEIQEYGNFNLTEFTTNAGVLVESQSGLGLIPIIVLDSFNPPDVIDQGLNTPPGGPSTGDKYIVGTSPTGAWAGKGNYVATYNGTAWDFSDPVDKETYYSVSDAKVFIYRGLTEEWEDTGFSESLGPVKNLTNTPPGSPSSGDTYATDGSPTGAWSGQAEKITKYNGSSWDFVTPFEGMRVINQTNNKVLEVQSATWVELSESPTELGITLYSPPS